MGRTARGCGVTAVDLPELPPPPDDPIGTPPAGDPGAGRDELAALGALLQGGDIDHAATVLPDATSDGWSRGAHASLWAAIRAVHGDGRRVDLVAVVDQLARTRTLDEVGGPSAVADVYAAAPPPSTAAHWCARVADRAWRRRLATRAHDVIAAAADLDADPAAAAVQLEAEVDAAPSSDDLQVLTGDRLDTLPEPEWVADRLIQRGLTVIWGHPSAGKSFVAVDLAVAVATGRPWRGGAVRPGRTLHLAGEGQAGLAHRYAAALDRVDATPAARAAVGVVGEPLDLTDSRDLARLDRAVRQHATTLLIVDTWARYALVADENDNAAAGRVVAALDRLRNRHDCDVIVVHHARKDGDDLRGASALRGALDTAVKVSRNGTRIKAVSSKVKDGPDWAHPLSWDLTTVGRTAVLTVPDDDEQTAATVRAVLDDLRSGRSVLEAATRSRHGGLVVDRLRRHPEVTVTHDGQGRPSFVLARSPL